MQLWNFTIKKLKVFGVVILLGKQFHYIEMSNFFRVENQVTTIYPADVVLFEGILVFYFPEIRDLFHMKLFVDTDSDTRLARRG